jgi:hypothetical protein
MKNLSSLCIFLGLAAMCHGQAPQQGPTPEPLPPGPLITRAPNPCQWLVSVKTNTGTSIEMPSPQTKYDSRTLVQKSGSIRREITAAADGSKFEKWFVGVYQATLYPGDAQPKIELAGVNGRAGSFTDYSKSDFSGFTWLSKRKYIGMQIMEGYKCIVFHDGPAEIAASPSAQGANAGPPPIPPTGTTAYIDVEKRLPILLEEDNVTTFFQWGYPSPSALTLPAAVQSGIDGIQTRIQQAAAPPGAP